MAYSEPPPFTFEPRPRRPLGLVVALCLVVGGGVLVGYGIGCTVIDERGDGPASYVAGDGIGVACLVGLGLVVVGVTAWLLLVARHRRGLSGWHGTGALALAAALGLLLAAAELEVGGRYLSVAAGIAAGGLAAMVAGSAHAARRRRLWRHEVRMIAEGRAVTGTVVDSGLLPEDFDEASHVITTATFGLTGADGTEYHVRRRLTIPRSVTVLSGQATTIWYDPADPLDDRSIVVALVHALRWNVPVPVPSDRDDPQRQASASV